MLGRSVTLSTIMLSFYSAKSFIEAPQCVDLQLRQGDTGPAVLAFVLERLMIALSAIFLQVVLSIGIALVLNRNSSASPS